MHRVLTIPQRHGPERPKGCYHHIREVAWRDPSDGGTGNSTTAVMVDWIDVKKNDARVRGENDDVQVRVVDAKPPYLRTYADGEGTNNLLSLPRY